MGTLSSRKERGSSRRRPLTLGRVWGLSCRPAAAPLLALHPGTGPSLPVCTGACLPCSPCPSSDPLTPELLQGVAFQQRGCAWVLPGHPGASGCTTGRSNRTADSGPELGPWEP
ncbi:hypothetical protein Cadr_000020751 [Camelus dromedarius]|uniref:Uncharacterized protein n=1 Tax=Camelus dromedarius TaxID=9838 RepID=A0A5N4CZE6_CAMDR|nr:hypothetical protein Cadr_000020751 [Camelus dromedarius]